MRRPLLLVTVALIACGGESPPTVVPIPPSPPSPPASASASARSAQAASAASAQKREPVVVAIVVDQLSSWVADSRIPLLPANANGGLTRLAREGTWCKKLTFPYAVTDTAPGHAALHTGKLPAETGLASNELPDPNSPWRVSVLVDPATRLVTSSGVKNAVASSAARLRVPTVADRLRAEKPDALVVSVSLKDRGAIVPAGKQPTYAMWFDTPEGAFVTSTAFAKTYPAWAKGVGDADTIAELRSTSWKPLDEDWLARSSNVKDDAPGEGDLEGLGTSFPHPIKTSAAFRATPASDVAITRLALAAVAAEWRADRPTLILLSFTANDVIGHVYGPDSWEAWDVLRRLDVTLGEFIDALEKKVGGPISVILSSDHGSVPMPESTKSRATVCSDCKTSERLSPQAVGAEIRAAVAKVIPGVDAKTLVAGLADPYVFLTPAARALEPAKRALVDKAVRDVLAKHKGVAQVLDTKTLMEKCPAALAKGDDDLLALVCRGWPKGDPNETGAGDYYLVMARGSFLDAEYTLGKGSSHGTPYAFDREVPLFVRTASHADAGTVVGDRVEFTTYAAIEASLLGLDPRTPHEIITAKK
jgi:predicted AlkP superfamily pyrophosphatase or phosphodiesterase